MSEQEMIDAAIAACETNEWGEWLKWLDERGVRVLGERVNNVAHTGNFDTYGSMSTYTASTLYAGPPIHESHRFTIESAVEA